MILEAGRHSDLLRWQEPYDPQEAFDLHIGNRSFEPDTIEVYINRTKYTFFAPYEIIEKFLRIYKLGAKGCFTGDIKISLLNGTEVPIKDLVGLEEFWVYSYDIESKKIVPGRAHDCRITKKDSPLVKVTLDSNEEIKCTLDHRFLLRNGEYKEAQYLKSEDSLMPLYRAITKDGDRYSRSGFMLDYEICHSGDGNWELTHRLVDEIIHIDICDICGANLSDKKHNVRHHKDFNKRNNSPDNIQMMTFQEHSKLHAEYGATGVKAMQSRLKELRKDPEYDIKFRKQSSINLTKTLEKLSNDPEYRKQNSEKLKKQWEDPNFRAKVITGTSKSLKNLFKDPIFYANHVERMRSLLSTPGYCEEHGMGWGVLNKDSEFQKKRLKGLQPYYDSGEQAEVMAENNKNVWSDPVKRAKRMQSMKRASHKRHHIEKNRVNIKCKLCKEEIDTQDERVFSQFNHKVKSVEFLDYTEDVYDFTVDKYRNFALTSGVFVHNSALAYLKENDFKDRLILLIFDNIPDRDAEVLATRVARQYNAPYSHYTPESKAGTIYYDKKVAPHQLAMIRGSIERLGYITTDTSPKTYFRLKVSIPE